MTNLFDRYPYTSLYIVYVVYVATVFQVVGALR